MVTTCLRQHIERCWWFCFICPVEEQPSLQLQNIYLGSDSDFQRTLKSTRHIQNCTLRCVCFQGWGGSLQTCPLATSLLSNLLKHQKLLSQLSLSICFLYPVQADKQQLAVVFGGRPAWSAAWSLETTYWAYAGVSNTFQCPSLCLELPSYSYQRRQQNENVKCRSHREDENVKRAGIQFEERTNLKQMDDLETCLIKVSLACHLLTQKAYYYYYRRAKQKGLIKSLVASGGGERLLSVEELMTSSQNKQCQSSKLCLFFLPAKLPLLGFQDVLREESGPMKEHHLH